MNVQDSFRVDRPLRPQILQMSYMVWLSPSFDTTTSKYIVMSRAVICSEKRSEEDKESLYISTWVRTVYAIYNPVLVICCR